jgi:signal transduction histidine kinase
MKQDPAPKPALTEKFIEVIERERRLLAQELHDGLTQEFAVLAIEMHLLERKLSRPEAAQLRALRERLHLLIETTRSIARRLHPSIVDDLGLTASLQALCYAFSVRPVVVTFAAEGVTSEIPSDTAVCLYRVVQESVHNAIKHSGCDKIQVRLSEVPQRLILTIQDLGKGFDVRHPANPNGLGLAIMGERVRFVGGQFSIRSGSNRGTLVRVTVPIQSH